MSKPSVMTLALLMGLSTTGCITGMYYEGKAREGDLEALEMFTTETYNGAWWDGQRTLRATMYSADTPMEARQKAMELLNLDSERNVCTLIWMACDTEEPETLRLQALKRLEDNKDNEHVASFFASGELSNYNYNLSTYNYKASLDADSARFFLKHLNNLDTIIKLVTAKEYAYSYSLDDKVVQEGLAERTEKELLQIIKKVAERDPGRARAVAANLKDETSIAAYVVLCGSKASDLNMDVVAKITSQALLGKLMFNPKIDKALHKDLFAKITEQETLIAIAKSEAIDGVLRRAAVLKIEDAATKAELAMAVLPCFYGGFPNKDETGESISDPTKYVLELAKFIQDEDFLCDAGIVFYNREERARGWIGNEQLNCQEVKDALWNRVSPETWARKFKEKQLKDEGQILFALTKVTDSELLLAIADDASYSERVRDVANEQLCDWEAIRKEVSELPKDVLAKEAAEVEARGKKVAEAANMFVINGLYLGMPLRDLFVLTNARNFRVTFDCYWDNEDKLVRVNALTIKRDSVYKATGIEADDLYGKLCFGSDLASFRSAETTAEDADRVRMARLFGHFATEDSWQESVTRAKNVRVRICIRGNEEGRFDLSTVEGFPNKPDYSKKATDNTDSAAAADALKLLGKAAQGAAELDADLQDLEKAKAKADEALRQLEAMPEMPEMPSF